MRTIDDLFNNRVSYVLSLRLAFLSGEGAVS
jgi:hypothetical protein